MYRHLDERQLLDTLRTLSDRIEERFPGSGLAHVSRELIEVGQHAAITVAWLRRPLLPVRIGAAVAAISMVVLLGVALVAALRSSDPTGASVWDVVQGIEALVNDIVFTGIAIWFMFTLEGRVKRKRALAAIHELRSVAHIVDMHQMTKDPDRLSPEGGDGSSAASGMTHGQLGRYLDYCSELLSVTSKLAALYVQNLADPVVLDAVSEVETLAGGLSSKIWQKITLLELFRSVQVGRVD